MQPLSQVTTRKDALNLKDNGLAPGLVDCAGCRNLIKGDLQFFQSHGESLPFK